MVDVAYGAKTILPSTAVDAGPKPTKAERKAVRAAAREQPEPEVIEAASLTDTADERPADEQPAAERKARRRLLRRGDRTAPEEPVEEPAWSADTGALLGPLPDDPRSELTMLATRPREAAPHVPAPGPPQSGPVTRVATPVATASAATSAATQVMPAVSVAAAPALDPAIVQRVTAAEAGLQRALSEIVRLQEFANGVVGELTSTRQRLAVLEQAPGSAHRV